jgi:hypothetical protein
VRSQWLLGGSSGLDTRGALSTPPHIDGPYPARYCRTARRPAWTGGSPVKCPRCEHDNPQGGALLRRVLDPAGPDLLQLRDAPLGHGQVLPSLRASRCRRRRAVAGSCPVCSQAPRRKDPYLQLVSARRGDSLTAQSLECPFGSSPAHGMHSRRGKFVMRTFRDETKDVHNAWRLADSHPDSPCRDRRRRSLMAKIHRWPLPAVAHHIPPDPTTFPPKAFGSPLVWM